jgi:hypothetical protein
MADTAGGAWTFGGSILTFAFPMILFIAVAGALYVLYTKPELVPGHRAPGVERPVSHTAVPGTPTAATQTREPGRISGALPTAEAASEHTDPEQAAREQTAPEQTAPEQPEPEASE